MVQLRRPGRMGHHFLLIAVTVLFAWSRPAQSLLLPSLLRPRLAPVTANVHRLYSASTASGPTLSDATASWSVDDDTAEIEWGSSSDKKKVALKAAAVAAEAQRVKEIEEKMRPMEEFRKQHDPLFKAWIERTGYTRTEIVVPANPAPGTEEKPTGLWEQLRRIFGGG